MNKSGNAYYKDNVYLLTVLRYIHQNPMKAGIAKKTGEWKWSSFSGYLGKPYYPTGLLDTDFILEIMSEDREKAIRKLIEYNEQENEDKCLEEIKRQRLTDKEAGAEIRKQTCGYDIAEIKSLPKEQRDEILKKIKEIEGLSLRQAARILGISHVLIFKA